MKPFFVLFSIIGILFITSCGNNSETPSVETDTSTTKSPAAEQTPPSQTTAVTGNDLMKTMNEMMGKMKALTMTGDFDIDFANMMIEHHQGAIDLAQAEVSNGKDEKVKSKAQQILTMQKDEQQKLKTFVSSYKPSGMKHGEGEMQKPMTDMDNKMKSLQMSGDIDKDFLKIMSSHHEDGLSMSKMELKNGMSADLKKMARKSIDEHQKDIKDLKGMMVASK